MTDSLKIHNPRLSVTKCRLVGGGHQDLSLFSEDPDSLAD